MRAGRRRAAGAILLLALVWPAAPGPAHGQEDAQASVQTGAGAGVLDAPAALARSRAGGLTIVDVRSAGEWASTGVPEGAAEVSLLFGPGKFNRNFVADVLAALGNDRETPIALVCATGQRSAYARKLLLKNGFSRVYSIAEGMAGSSAGPGWLARGLPVERCKNC